MPERVLPGPVQHGTDCIKEAVCVHTRKIYDACKDKDCVEDLRVYLSAASQPYIDSAVSVRPRSARLLHVAVDVEEVSFNRGYYTVDIRYFYQIRAEAYSLLNAGQAITGLAVFDKRVILFGSEGSAKVFSSADNPMSGSVNPLYGGRQNLPTAVVEAVDPIVLGMKLVDACDMPCCCDGDPGELPQYVRDLFGEELSAGGNRKVYVTLGQFSIVRMERDSQLLIPAYDYCMPEKECCGPEDGEPCELFRRIRFPVSEFFPPDTVSDCEDYRAAKAANED